MTATKTRIELFGDGSGHGTYGVLVPGPTGTVFFTWVGNVAQRRVEIEGAWIPLPDEAARLNRGAVSHLWGHDLPMRVRNENVIRTWQRCAAGTGFQLPSDALLESFCRDHPRAALLADAWVPLVIAADAASGPPLGKALVPYSGRVVVVAWPNRGPVPGTLSD